MCVTESSLDVLDQIDAFFSLSDRFRRWLTSRSAPTEKSVAGRFVFLFETHGVHRNQIPRFLGHGLTLADMQDDASLLGRLDEPLLEAVCNQFAVRRKWLDGASAQAHPCHNFYKQPDAFVGFIEKLLADNPDADMSGLLVAPERPEADAVALLFLKESIGTVDDELIYRYHLCNNWVFSYWKARAYLTACVAIAWRYKVYVHGVYASAKEIGHLAAGETLMGWQGKGFQGLGFRRWYPDDMALKPEVFLKDVDPERQRFGWRSALDLWLDLDRQGLMYTGIDVPGVRERFLAEQAKF